MCTESQIKETSTIGKVSHVSEPSVHPPAPFSTPINNRGATTSVLAKLKKLVKKVIVIHGARRRIEERKFDSLRTFDDGFVVETELDNVANENKSNVDNFNSKIMAYTIEELKDIVDDNLANELREIKARENR